MTKKFKDYVIEPIPDNWIVDRIGRLLLKEFSGTWGPENAYGINVLRSTNFQDNGYLNLDSVAVREIGENYPSGKKICVGDILLERSGGGPQQPVGRVSWCDDRVAGWVFSNFCQLLRPSVKVGNKFLFFALYYLHLRTITLTYQNQTTGIRNLEYKSYLKIPIPLPPLPEQRKIAEILSTVDETIEKTDAIIQETQQLKKGLVQKLFTKGVRHTRFKETKIGRIPEEWEVVSIRGINKARFDSVNPANSPQEIFEYYSIPAYLECGMPAIERGESILSNKLLVTSNTVLFGKLNPRVLKVWLVKPSTTYRQVASTEFLPILPNEKAVPGFIYYLCQSAFIAENSKQYAVGTTPSRQRVNPKAFYDMPLPLPPLLEQRKIAEILSEVDTKIETAKAFKAELEQLKKGLMQVLLTGKVRVKV